MGVQLEQLHHSRGVAESDAAGGTFSAARMLQPHVHDSGQELSQGKCGRWTESFENIKLI